MQSRDSISIRNLTRARIPRVDFDRHARSVLGASYELSLAFLPPREAQRLNRTYRGKSYVPNVLSFPLSPREGEIVMCPSVAKRQAREWSEPYARFIERLFIHALLHLKGYRHGTKMRSAERRLARRGVRR